MNDPDIATESPPSTAALGVLENGLHVHHAKFSPEQFEEFVTAAGQDGSGRHFG